MAKEVTYEEIVRNLKNRIYAPVYFLMGEEDYYIDRIADYIIDTVLSETEKEFNLTVTYGADTDVANVINAAKRYPMMSEYQVVVVKEAQSLKRIEELAFYLQKPQKSTILVVCYKHGSIDRRKKLAAEIEKNGVLFESRKLKDSQIPGFISSYLNPLPSGSTTFTVSPFCTVASLRVPSPTSWTRNHTSFFSLST